MHKKLVGIIGLAAISAALLGVGAAEASNCKKPRALIVLDKSSSMITGSVGGKSKWEIAKGALSQVLATYQTSVDFGLMLFPSPNQCGPGKVKVEIGPTKAGPIMAELNDPPDTEGFWTPMAQSLDEATKLPQLNDSAYVTHVLLITDGWQWCHPYEASTRHTPVNSVTNLKNLNITTWVVGFGDSVDTLTLNMMAEAAGTKIAANCNVASDDSKAPNNCYYQANDPTQLVQALQNVVQKISNELCDGEDNNCNGQIDEGLAGPSCVKQQGVCAGAQKACGGKHGWSSCTAADYDKHAVATSAKYESSESLCDGKDNDCDGTVDEGCACASGQTRPCGVSVGECRPGSQVCVNGTWGQCANEIKANTEVCDGKDNDCNGVADENLTRSCSSACGPGTEKCQGGQWVGCTAQAPAAEICDSIDNDCDGVVDGPTAVCDNGGVCTSGVCEPITAGGCSCELDGQAGAGATPAGLLTLALLGLALVLRRRR